MTLTIAQQEAIYDAQRSGQLYVKPFTADDKIALAREADRILAEPDMPIQIERHTHHTDGSKASDPWTTYTLGEASISVQDAGGGNLCIGHEMLEIEDNTQLLDLAQLLADAQVVAALDRDDEYTPLSPAWEAVLSIISDPTNDGSDDVCSICGASEDCDCDDRSEAEIARENAPVPPVPAGYPTDRAMIYQTIGTAFVCIDRRDGEMVICEKNEIASEDNSIILPPAYVLALAQFLSQADMRELVAYHRGAAAVAA